MTGIREAQWVASVLPSLSLGPHDNGWPRDIMLLGFNLNSSQQRMVEDGNSMSRLPLGAGLELVVWGKSVLGCDFSARNWLEFAHNLDAVPLQRTL